MRCHCSISIAAFVLLLFRASHVQAQSLELPLTPRVDTTRAEIREIYLLWRAYLSTRPDSVRYNPNWSEKEQARYRDFDISRRWLYGYPLRKSTIHGLLGIRPRLLSIEPEGDAYAIRTLYAPDHLNDFQGLYSIQRVYARRERGAWRLSNALPVVTKAWVRRRYGLIEYIFPPNHVFDETAAHRASAFADSVIAEFQLDFSGPVEYYVAPSVSEMARISGLDFTWDTNDGKAYSENRQVFVGNGREDYLHELVHVLFGSLDAMWILSEGLATYLGGFGQQSFGAAVAEAGLRVTTMPETQFDDLLHGNVTDYLVFYVTGGLIIEAVVEHGGLAALKRFFQVARTPEGVYKGLQDILDVAPEEADGFWRERLHAPREPEHDVKTRHNGH